MFPGTRFLVVLSMEEQVFDFIQAFGSCNQKMILTLKTDISGHEIMWKRRIYRSLIIWCKIPKKTQTKVNKTKDSSMRAPPSFVILDEDHSVGCQSICIHACLNFKLQNQLVRGALYRPNFLKPKAPILKLLIIYKGSLIKKSFT